MCVCGILPMTVRCVCVWHLTHDSKLCVCVCVGVCVCVASGEKAARLRSVVSDVLPIDVHHQCPLTTGAVPTCGADCLVVRAGLRKRTLATGPERSSLS